MSLVNAIQISPDKAAESFPEPKKHSKISYTREFLLSLSGLDVCKNLPSGFDRSTLSEFEDAFQAIQDRQRIPGSLPLQGYGRTDHGTSPPTRGDSSNYSRGSYGRWDNRSSGRNERDGDSLPDWDSELMSKSSESKKDPAWQYAQMVNPQNLSKFICNFCDKEMNGGVYRVKQHLAGGYKNVVACKKCPSHVKDEIKDYMSQKSQSKVQLRMVPDFDEMDNDDDDDDEILEINQHGKGPVSTQGSTRREQGSNSSKSVGSKQPKQKGPMDVYFTPDPEVAVQNRKAKGKQTRIDDNDPSKKVLRDRALVWFSRWMYDTGIPFNVVNYSSFGPMVEAFGQYGPGMKPPSYHEVRVPYLQKEVDHTNKTMEDHKKDWATYGCSLMADGWKDKRNRALINFLVNCPRGSMFIESVDVSSLSKDANKMFELLDNFVECIGEANVVQVVTDSASANVLAGKFLEAKRPHLYWTPCAAHCLDLMLEDIFKIPNFNKTFEKAIAVHGYIVNRSGLLNMMRQFTQCKDLIKPAKTRFATAFLTLSRIHQQQTNLKKMFTSEEWSTSKWAKKPQGKKTAQVILMPSFWNNVLYALKISSPLVRVLRLVDGERKPPMGYIYEAMDRAKEAIAKSFNGNEEKYKEFFEIIDNRWNVQLHRPLHAAGYYLNPEYFYANPNIEKDKEVMSGLYKCIQRLVPSNETQDKVCAELTTYKKADGLFGMALAIRQRTTRAPDSGRRHSNQSRWSWQNSEHDGLLGSGSFPRPSGFPAGLSASKVRSNDLSQLNRSTEPYQPPRPYKAVPHSRRENSDSFNDETFGSAECTSQDRAEEERRRRESFELMRKEQQKAFQEKQKLNPNKHKDDHVSDLCKLLGDTKEGKSVLNRGNELDEIMTQAVSNNDSSKSSLQTFGARPLVPPGFKSTTLEMNSSTRSLTHSHSAEVGKPEFEESLSHAKAIVQNGNINNQEERQLVQKMGFREQQHENTSIHSPSLNKGEQIVDSSTDLEVSFKKLGVDNQLYKTSSLSEASQTQDGSEIVEFDTKKVTRHKIISDSKQNHSTGVLEKIFGNVLTVNLSGSTGVIEHHDSEQDDTWSPNAVKSSKFADWFLEDEKKAAEDPSHTRPRNLLSLIIGGEKGGSQVSDVKATKHVLPDISFQNSEPTNWHLTSNMTSSTIGISEPLYNCSKQEAIPAILTCEDLEQTILSEYSESGSTLQDPVQIWSDSSTKTKVSKADIDDHASQHLLSLLQKGTDLKDMTESPNLDGGLLDKHNVSEGAIVGSALDNSRVEKVENIQHSGKNLTLETLFGSAFMKELQSVEAPVSIQRGSVGSARTDISEPHGSNFGVMGGGLFPASVVGVGSNRSSDESNILQSSQRQQLNSDEIENWLGINNTQVKVDPSKHQNDLVSKLGGFDGGVDILLPEEENLITVGDPVNMSNTSNKTVVIAEKLSALNTVLKDIRPMVGREGPPFIRGPYDPMEPEIPFGKLHAQQPSSPQFHPPRMNHGRPFFHPLDLHPTHASSQMNFMAPEGIVHRDAPTTRQFPVNMMRPPFHHPNTGSTGFDIPHQPVLQQMQMPGNYPPSHLRREVPRGGGPLPPHPSNHATGFMQELNPMQSFPFGQQQPKFGGLGMPSQAPDVSGGSNHPEAFQRLLEMERRANSKQIHPLAAVGHSQGMYGHELDTSFLYR